MKKIRFGIIGCGRISSKHVEALISKNDKAELVAVYDVVEELALQRKEQYESLAPGTQVKVYTDYNGFLEDKSIDAVTIASISGYHAKHAIDCLSNDKHVLIEKPMALNLEDIDHIIELGKEKNKKICVSHQNRFIPVFQEIKRAVEEGRFGKLIHGSARTLWNRNDEYYRQASWRGTKALDGGTLLNQCIHNIDLLQWLMGEEVERVSAELDTFIRDIETEDFGAMLIRFKNGAVGVVEGSVCVYPQNLEESLSIFGEKGTVVISNGKVKTWEFEDKFVENICLDKENQGHKPLYADFIDAINDNREPLINGEEAKIIIDMILKVLGD